MSTRNHRLQSTTGECAPVKTWHLPPYGQISRKQLNHSNFLPNPHRPLTMARSKLVWPFMHNLYRRKKAQVILSDLEETERWGKQVVADRGALIQCWDTVRCLTVYRPPHSLSLSFILSICAGSGNGPKHTRWSNNIEPAFLSWPTQQLTLRWA